MAIPSALQVLQEGYPHGLGRVMQATPPLFSTPHFFTVAPRGRGFPLDAVVRRLRARCRGGPIEALPVVSRQAGRVLYTWIVPWSSIASRGFARWAPTEESR